MKSELPKPRSPSYTEYYTKYFRENDVDFVELTPTYPTQSETGRRHLDLDEIGNQVEVQDFDKYTHPCWCNPELVYADPIKGNEVWLHKPEQ